jgi:hypothetical protein
MIEREVQKIRENLQGNILSYSFLKHFVFVFLAFVQDKDTQSKDAETEYNRLDTMQNRTYDITRQYWILNDQYRLLNTTILNAIENHEKVKLNFENNVRKKISFLFK